MTDLTLDNKKAGRLAWIDWAKVFGIFLVVLGHMPVLSGKVFIYMFHMPFFFMLSGFLYKPISIKEEFKKSFKSLIVPYLFFNFILVLISVLTGIFNWNIIFNIILGNQEVLPARFFRPLWFIVSLFVMRIASSVVKEKYYWLLLIVSLFISIVLKFYDVFQSDYTNDFFQWQTTILCIPFFLFGYLIKKIIGFHY